MADVLRTPARRFWAVDKLFLAYVVFSSVLVLGWWNQIPDAAGLFTVHLAGAALLVFEVKFPNGTSWLFRNWYPLPYVGFCYKEMALLIPAVRHTDADQWLANLDFRIWHANPTVWLERIQTPASHRIRADGLHAFHPGRAAGGVADLDANAFTRSSNIMLF